MNLQDRAKEYLEYCTYRKELDAKTVKAYRIDLKQYFSLCAVMSLKKKQLRDILRICIKNTSRKQ